MLRTGARAKHAFYVEDEPYWRTLVRLIDWAENNTASTIWLCLAAHAAVRHLDGVERRPFPKKLSGVFTCKKAVEHPILDGLPSTWSVPHSRSNDVSEQALVAHGYRILSRSPDVGADLFARHKQSLFPLRSRTTRNMTRAKSFCARIPPRYRKGTFRAKAITIPICLNATSTAQTEALLERITHVGLRCRAAILTCF